MFPGMKNDGLFDPAVVPHGHNVHHPLPLLLGLKIISLLTKISPPGRDMKSLA